MRQYLAGQENEEHANRGMRKALIAQMEGGAEAYEGAFREARMGKTYPQAYSEQARIARLADLFPKDFERTAKSMMSSFIRGLAEVRQYECDKAKDDKKSGSRGAYPHFEGNPGKR